MNNKFILKIFYLSIFFTLSGCTRVKEYEFYSYYKDYINQSGKTFLSNYPINEYLKRYGVYDVNTLQGHRAFLNEKKNIGDAFLCKIIEEFTVVLSNDSGAKKASLAFFNLGESYLSIPVTLQMREAEIFHVIGYYLLGKTAHTLEKNKSSFDDSEYKYYRAKLKEYKILLSVEEDWWTKTKNRSIKQIWDRVKKTFTDDTRDVLVLVPYNDYNMPTDGVTIFNMYENNVSVGASIWMKRSEVCCKYLASKDILDKYNELCKSKKVILAASGGFTNDLRQPEGLTIQNGEIINAVLKPDRDGLVIVEQGGGIRTCNLKGYFLLPEKKDSINPIKSLSDYIQLVSWCKQNKATVFQTQLLVFGNIPLIDPQKAPKEIRERRFLVTARDLNSGELLHIIFNFRAGKNLANATFEVFDVLKKRNKKVESILNLDVGNFNTLKIFNFNGQEVSSIKGTKEVNSATNLLIYHLK